MSIPVKRDAFFIFTEKSKMRKICILLATVFFVSCAKEKLPVDLLVTNATVYTVDESFSTSEAFVITDGKIVETGTAKDIQKKYIATETFDAEGKTILPGLIDAHAHLYGLGSTMQQVDLMGTKSEAEVLERVVAFQKEKNTNFITGRGWDQNDWEVKEFPNKRTLDSLFPDTPVALTRVDGHAFWANSKAMEMAGVTARTKMPGGEVVVENGEPSGILVDTPMRLIRNIIPKADEAFNKRALKDAEAKCFEMGLTTVSDAGLDRSIIETIDGMQQVGELKIRVYAMVTGNTPNLDFFLKNGIVKTDRLTVRSFKVYADGALGSRGAALREPYSDKEGHFGAMITHVVRLDELAKRISNAGFQMNTHAIGDSANYSVLKVYEKHLINKPDARWRIEHAQVLHLPHINKFSTKIIPSVQPTHATSDMYWAEDRVGPDRIKGAYAYKSLLNSAGIIALGTDFPVENVNPMYTFYAAVARKDLENYPEGGYRMKEALSREETLKGMTIWAAFANFEEDVKGSLEAGKFADFVVLDTNIMTCEENDIPNTKVLATFVGGEKVY